MLSHTLLFIFILPLLAPTLTHALATPIADPIALAYAAALAAASPEPTDYDQASQYGGSAGGSAVNTDAGASGGGKGFELSTGAVAAICVVCALVVIFGVTSAVLFYLAKKRNWAVRKSISRASRRVTARVTGKSQQELDRKEREKQMKEREKTRQDRKKGAERLRDEYLEDRGLKGSDVEKGAGVMTTVRGGDVEMTEGLNAGRKGEKKVVAVMPPK